jgi:hypothetical protein
MTDETVTTATEPRTPPAPLEMQYPLCPLCKEEVYYDDIFRCVPCGASWPATVDGSTGTWDGDDWDNEVPRCASTIQPFRDSGHENIRDQVYQCELNEDHLDVDPAHYPVKRWDGTPIGEPLHHRAAEYDEWNDADQYVTIPALSSEERAERAEERDSEGRRQDAERRVKWTAEREAHEARKRDADRSVEAVPVGEVL